MVRWENVSITYFVTAVLMWGSGLTDFENSGVLGAFFTADGGVTALSGSTESGGLIGALGALAGPLEPVIAIFITIIELAAWPVFTLEAVGAPPEVSLLMGGTLTFALLVGASGEVFRNIANAASNALSGVF